YLIKENIINDNLKVNYYMNEEKRRLSTILSFLEAHCRSYFHIQEIGYKYSKMNNIGDLDEWKKRRYVEDLIWFQEVNEICEEYGV
ncbi:11933_t:CDS:1, partial [Dentiscutata heterogama]